MNHISRKKFLKQTAIGLGAVMLPYPLQGNHNGLRNEYEIAFRFAVAGDLHFGGSSDYHKKTSDMVRWMNEEKKLRGLDMIFLIGDLVHDRTDVYEELRDDYLLKLNAPYYASKGNHDFLEPEQTWEDIWGYPENHMVEHGDLAFVFGDTSIGENLIDHYSAADYEWLSNTLKTVQSQKSVFVILHIVQRQEGVDGWPRYGVGHRGRGDTSDGEKVMHLLESSPNVKAIFHGHNHDEKGRYISGGKPFFFCSRLGHTWGNKKGYRIVEIYKSGPILTYQYDAENSRIVNHHIIAG